jgi:hypothetical protein
MVTIWKSSKFNGHVVFQNEFSLSIEFTSMISGHSWILTQVYAPCTTEGKQNFLDWLYNIDMQPEVDWLVIGDFNLIRKPEDRNKPGGNVREMLDFNATINKHGLDELRLNGTKFTWTSNSLHYWKGLTGFLLQPLG